MLEKDIFLVRRGIERLRDGLFDPISVNQLTVENKRVQTAFSDALLLLEKGQPEHLCICGSYGQGKSHTIAYLNQQALSKGYAVSVVQLDLREVPFHQFPIVYQAIMEKLTLPDGRIFSKAWKQQGKKSYLESTDVMPHRFRMILTAMLCKNKRLTSKEKTLKKHRNYRPKEFGYWLDSALMGRNIPAVNLKRAFKYRGVEAYSEQPLSCKGNLPYLQMLQALGQLLKNMGYKGLVLFFDEAESIAQARINTRAKSYFLLDKFFQNNNAVYPVFAFTDDFFDKVNHEPYDNDKEIFSKNYANAWNKLNLERLYDFSSQKWDSLLDRLIRLYAQAYQISLPAHTKETLRMLLKDIEAQETRFKLKALVNQLDLESQPILLRN